MKSGSATEFAYVGAELDAFAVAVNWKTYWSSKLRPLVKGCVIEVGAGPGEATRYLNDGTHPQWLCLDPDISHISKVKSQIERGELPASCTFMCGILADLDPAVRADTIVYIDVLEHIDQDEAEMRVAAAHLNGGGRIIVLAPAFNQVFSAFDKAVGHFRRYVKADASRLTVSGLVLEQSFYLDCAGFAAALANRFIIRAAIPSKSQVWFWDRFLVPLSTVGDRAFGSLFGKTIVMIWRKS